MVLSNDQAFHWANEATSAKGLREDTVILKATVKQLKKVHVADSTHATTLNAKIANQTDIIVHKQDEIDLVNGQLSKKEVWNRILKKIVVTLAAVATLETFVIYKVIVAIKS